ncbi:MAG TPA: hypothetical protein VIX84_15210, partial [Acidimicrobiales bacterium]
MIPPHPVQAGFHASIFDMDGLLIDSEILWHEAEIEILGALGVPIAPDEARNTKGMFVGEVTEPEMAQRGLDQPVLGRRCHGECESASCTQVDGVLGTGLELTFVEDELDNAVDDGDCDFVRSGAVPRVEPVP